MTPVAPWAGAGLPGTAGGVGGPAVGSVLNDQTAPVVVPLLFFATICQKYVVPPISVGGAYQKSVVFVTTAGGGFVAPNRTSYDVAPADFQLSVGVTVTQVAPLGGFGEFGAAGPDGGGPAARVVNDQIGLAVEPAPFFATTCQKSVRLLASVGGVYDVLDCPVDTCGGGLLVPNFTS